MLQNPVLLNPAVARDRGALLRSALSPRSTRDRSTAPPRDTSPTWLALIRLLSQRRWAFAVLAELQRNLAAGLGGGAKFVALSHRLGTPRATLQLTLSHLLAHDFILRNPGYGHPMRPEYLLAERGYAAAPGCLRVLETVKSSGGARIAFGKWMLPALAVIGDAAERDAGEYGPDTIRFRDLRAGLSAVTPRALTLALKDLSRAGLIERRVVDAYPPVATYGLSAAGEDVFAALKQIREG